MPRGPNRNTPDHRMVRGDSDVALLESIGADQDQADQHEEDGRVTRPDGGRPQPVGGPARLREPPNDEDEADQRKQRVDALPRTLAQLADRLGAAALGNDTGRVKS